MATFLQTLLQAASAIAIRARPGFGPVEVTAILAIVSIFDRKQFEIFLPIWTFFGERRGTETRLDPMGRTISADASLLSAPPEAWAGFAYVSVVSMFLGFFAWYRGLALGGIAIVGQVQLLQPFMTIFASALLLSERIDAATLIAAALVIVSIAITRKS